MSLKIEAGMISLQREKSQNKKMSEDGSQTYVQNGKTLDR